MGQINFFLLKRVSYICQVWSAIISGFHIQQEFISFCRKEDTENIALAKKGKVYPLR